MKQFEDETIYKWNIFLIRIFQHFIPISSNPFLLRIF